jgi:ornithine--oxo-acid transaminase
MIENAERQGARFLSQLQSIRCAAVREVRGRGLMLAVELMPEAGGARRYCERLREAGLLAKDTHEHTIRFAPPLIVTAEEVDWASEVIARALKD